MWAWCVAVAALSLSPFAGSAQQAQPTHPLDALTGAELSQVKAILQAEGKLGPKARFHSVDLDEPEKAAVTVWRPGTSLPRRAIAVVSESGTVHQAAIDLSAGRMTAWQTVSGEPALLLGEMIGAADMALADSRMVQALAKRGLTPGQVFCLPLTAGNFGRKEEQGQRLLKVPCYAKPTGSNVWARPIEGLFATVDLKTGKAIDVTDTGIVPVSAEAWGYSEAEVAAHGALRPETNAASLSQPPGKHHNGGRPRFISGTCGVFTCGP
jgi:primary-amine oxidase